METTAEATIDAKLAELGPIRADLGLPRSVRFVPDLPKTSTGKVMRQELKTLDG